MAQTDNLSLPYILASQAQKHVTHNEALLKLDAIVQLSCKSRQDSTPPSEPAEGDRYIVPNGATGDFAGYETYIAAFQDGVFQFYEPQSGWRAMLEDEVAEVYFDGSLWVDLSGMNANVSLGQLGINATADLTNRFLLSSDASLFNHSGTSHQLKINKSTTSDSASLLFQTGFSGRAEFGLSGDDLFRVKISSDGSIFNTALEISDGNVKFGTPLELQSHPTNTLPDAGVSGRLIFVSDASGGSIVAFSDGSNWRRLDTRDIIS